MAKLGPESYFRPHPYAPEVQGGLPFHAADHAQWDAEFPDHPLTRVRRTLDVLAEAVTVDPPSPHCRPSPDRARPGPDAVRGRYGAPAPYTRRRRRSRGTGSDGAGRSDGQTSQPTKWTMLTSRLVRKFIWSFSLCVMHVWDVRGSGLQPVDCALQSSRPAEEISNESPYDHAFQRTPDPLFVCSGRAVRRSCRRSRRRRRATGPGSGPG